MKKSLPMIKGFLPISQFLTTPSTTGNMIPKCGACGLSTKCKSPKLKPVGKGGKDILIVSESPGPEEDKAGKLMVGNSSKLLNDMLLAAGINMRDDCVLTNAMICHTPKNLTRDPQRVSDCRPNLINTINELNPKVVILMGHSAVSSLIPYVWKDDIGEMNRWVGFQFPSQVINAWICPVHHPSYLLRMDDPNLTSAFANHITAATKLKSHPWKELPGEYESRIEVIMDENDALSRLASIQDGVIAFDYESDMLKPDTEAAEIVSCSVCHNGEWTIAFPWTARIQDEMKRIYADKKVGKIASNLKFEDRWSRKKVGTPVKSWIWDTMIAAHLLDSRGGITSIKFQSFLHLGVKDYDSHIKPLLSSDGGNTKNRIREIEWNKLLIYNGLDSLFEYEVAKKQSRLLGFGDLIP